MTATTITPSLAEAVASLHRKCFAMKRLLEARTREVVRLQQELITRQIPLEPLDDLLGVDFHATRRETQFHCHPDRSESPGLLRTLCTVLDYAASAVEAAKKAQDKARG